VSAAGGILNCRNAAYQAVYTVQGVTDNVHDLTLTQLLQKKTFKELITILGTGIGKDFDINKLRYNKVIICTDSDIDGSNITSLLLCFFFKFMPELIRGGYLYKAMPPLYLMDLRSLRKFTNSREWLYDKVEYYNMLNNIICDNCEFALELPKYGKSRSKLPEIRELSRREALAWLNMNSEYQMELDNLGKKAACDTRIVEMICYLKLRYPNKMEFKEQLETQYPEMTYDISTNSLIGSVDGQFFTVICDRLFDKTATRFMEELRKNECFYVWYRNRKNPSDKMTRATIGEFMGTMSKVFDVKIEQRFKGLNY
jgi:DNA gyrase/topoisomerase IV subunit B